MKFFTNQQLREQMKNVFLEWNLLLMHALDEGSECLLGACLVFIWRNESNDNADYNDRNTQFSKNVEM